jgi:D-3-phosphoglycerate dehydrogenase
VLDRFRPVLKDHGIDVLVVEVSEHMGEADLLRYAGRFDGTVCGDDAYTARVLEACSPRLKVISKWGTGVDSIDGAACDRLGIRLYRTPNAFTTPVADSVLGYILAFARRQPWMDRDMKGGKWRKLPARAMSECSLGIVGVGNIGKAVARRARVFGMKILGNDIVEIDHVFLEECGMEMTTLDSLLARSDYVSLNCDLNPSSRHLITAESLLKMKSDAILINTARGAIVDEAALVEALLAKRLAGAALDVFEAEPLAAESPLLGMENVLLAPHNANSSPAAWDRVHTRSIVNLLEGLGISNGESASPLDAS